MRGGISFCSSSIFSPVPSAVLCHTANPQLRGAELNLYFTQHSFIRCLLPECSRHGKRASRRGKILFTCEVSWFWVGSISHVTDRNAVKVYVHYFLFINLIILLFGYIYICMCIYVNTYNFCVMSVYTCVFMCIHNSIATKHNLYSKGNK